MFRKSVSFFILVALFWVLLWVYIPDASPDKFSISDFFRGFFLLFSLMAFAFALLMLIIRYKGIDIATNLIPHGALTLWLAKHAFEYSQPKVIFHCSYRGADEQLDIEISMAEQSHQLKLFKNSPQTLHLGVVTENPRITWGQKNTRIAHEIGVLQDVKLIGRNLEYDLQVADNGFKLSRR